jgi:hypothetical protein
VFGWFLAVAKGKAASTVNGCMRVIKLLIADGTAQYRLEVNPAARLRAIPERQIPEKKKPGRTGLFESGRRDLNPRRPPWQGGTLPLSYSREVGG